MSQFAKTEADRRELARAALKEGEEICRGVARQLVGRVGLKEAQEFLRESMHREALARTNGSRRAAANLLGVHRRYVQRLASDRAANDAEGVDALPPPVASQRG